MHRNSQVFVGDSNNEIIHVTTGNNELPGTTIGLKSIDLVSVTSEEFHEEDDNISIDEGRLQQWHFGEFKTQFKGISAAILLLVACYLQCTWSINEYFKLMNDEQNESTAWNSSAETATGYEFVDNLFTSESVVVTLVIVSWNIGAIFGGILAAFIVPVVPNKMIYIAASSFLSFGGISLFHNGSVYQFIKGRFLVGLTHGLVQLTVTVQAAESTTKKVRRIMLTIIVYMCTLATLVSTIFVIKLDESNAIDYDEFSEVTRYISYGIFSACTIAMVLNLLFTDDTIVFFLSRGDETKAFKLLSKLKSTHLSMIDIRYEFERIRFDVVQEQLHTNRSIRAKSNFIPLTTMCAVRILNLLFTNIPMTILLALPVVYDHNNSNRNSSDDRTIDSEDIKLSPLGFLLMLQIIRMIFGFCITIWQNKYRFNRFVYKLSALCGICLTFSFIIRVVLPSFHIRLWPGVIAPLPMIIGVAYLTLPLPLDCLQMVQTADSYARCKNTWMIAFAIFIEHFVHIILIVQMDLMFDIYFVYVIIGACMAYLGVWLLKAMPNECAIHPISIAVMARYPFKRADHETMHM